MFSMRMSTPVLITGASGFVGSNLLRRLIKEVPPKRVHIVLRKNSDTWRIDDILKKVSVHIVDLRSQSAADALVRRVKPKTIFYLAVHGAYSCQQHDEKEIFDTNILCTFHLMQSCLQFGFDAFINTGSIAEYGTKKKPMREDDVLKPMTAYGASKAWATLYGQYAALAKKAPIVTLRLSGVYGFYESRGRLIPNVILTLLKNERPRLATPQTASDFIFIDDVVRAYLRAAERPSAGTIFNIGSGEKTTLAEIFSLIAGIMRVRTQPVWDKSMARSFDSRHRVADIRLAQSSLGWEPKTSLRDGLQKTVDWFQKNNAFYSKT